MYLLVWKKNCWFNNNYFLFNIIKKRTISRLHVSKQGDAGHNHDHFMGWKIPQAFGDCIHGYEHVSVCWWSPKNHPNALQHVRSISNFLYRFEYLKSFLVCPDQTWKICKSSLLKVPTQELKNTRHKTSHCANRTLPSPTSHKKQLVKSYDIKYLLDYVEISQWRLVKLHDVWRLFIQRKVDKAMTENVDLKGNHSFFFSFVSSFSFVLAIERYRECAKDKY